MELKFGMYVRTKEGYIAKILGIDYMFEGEGNDLSNIDAIFLDRSVNEIGKDIFSGCLYIFKDAKASYNIIDLIEVGDYVNGRCVGRSVHNGFIKLEVYSYDDYGDDYLLVNEDIKSIVTKEQFESMSYKVGE